MSAPSKKPRRVTETSMGLVPTLTISHVRLLPVWVVVGGVKRSSACAAGLMAASKTAAARILGIAYMVGSILRSVGRLSRQAPVGLAGCPIRYLGVRSDRTMFDAIDAVRDRAAGATARCSPASCALRRPASGAEERALASLGGGGTASRWALRAAAAAIGACAMFYCVRRLQGDAMTEKPIVEFFFSPGSRYSYLAASQIPSIEAETGCVVDWRPVNGADVRARRGRDPFAGDSISGQYDWDYRRHAARVLGRL